MDQKDIFTKPYNTTMFAYSVLKRLKSGSVETFQQRFKSQKIQYFAQLFGVSPTYQYNLYLKGPYSPDLANDLFKIKEKNIEVKIDKFVVEDLESRFNKLNEFLKDKSLRELEVIATLHWLIKIAKLSVDEAKKKLIELKEANSNEIKYAFQSVNKLPWLN